MHAGLCSGPLKNAGFTTGTPWIDVNSNYQTINVAAALADKNSLFYTYQEMIRLRKEHPLIVWGDFELLETVEEVISFIVPMVRNAGLL